MSANIRHSSGSPQWGTQPSVIAIGQRVLKPFGVERSFAIDVDPFSEEEFNRHVGAARILTGAPGLDGFRDRWLDHELFPRADHVLANLHTGSAPLPGDGWDADYTALVNPPGDELGENVKRAYRLLVTLWDRRWLDSALYVGFTLNGLQTLQGLGVPSPLADTFAGLRCVPDVRLPFVAHCSRPPTRVNKHGVEVDNDDAPSHPMFFMVLPSHDERVAAEQRRLFESMAIELGDVF